MSRRKDQSKPTPPEPKGKADAAFDQFLKQGLHNIFDGIANEPVPEWMLDMLERDADKSDKS